MVISLAVLRSISLIFRSILSRNCSSQEVIPDVMPTAILKPEHLTPMKNLTVATMLFMTSMVLVNMWRLKSVWSMGLNVTISRSCIREMMSCWFRSHSFRWSENMYQRKVPFLSYISLVPRNGLRPRKELRKTSMIWQAS